jgi:DNA-binding LacI/PurR family transcriptional regulator
MEQIRQRRWMPGERLPSENEWAERFHVSRITVKGALEALVKEGIVYRIQGRGTYIAESLPPSLLTAPDSAQLAPASSSLVALIMPVVANLFTARLLSGIQAELAAAGYSLVFFQTLNSADNEQAALREAARLGVKGMIVLPVEGEGYSEELLQLTMNKYPVVVVDRYLRGVDTNCVCSDHEGGAYEAIRYLLGMGHRRIAFISTPYRETTSLEDRLAGYERALAEQRLAVDHELRLFRTDRASIRAFLERRPDITAVFAANAGVARDVILAAEELRLPIPQKLSLLFFDDYENADLSAVPPTVIDQQEKQLGCEAVRLLLALIQDPFQPRKRITLPTRLVVRSSVAPLPVQKPVQEAESARNIQSYPESSGAS